MSRRVPAAVLALALIGAATPAEADRAQERANREQAAAWVGLGRRSNVIGDGPPSGSGLDPPARPEHIVYRWGARRRSLATPASPSLRAGPVSSRVWTRDASS